jgi:protein SCO1/2/putative membrane protein
MRRSFAVGLVASALAALGLAGCAARSPDDDDDYGPVGEFTLVERGEQTVPRSDLSGKVWVAAFIFTRCAGPCALVSQSMDRLQRDLAGLKEVRLVSFTVDPEWDKPPVLRAYAERYGADPGRWLFLTGERDELYRLIRHDFHLGVDPTPEQALKPGYEVEHSTHLVLVDGRGHIRGYFSGTDPEALPELERKVRLLVWQGRLPAVNAALNGTSAVLLLFGYAAIRRRWVGLHKACMLTALAVSALFLASYLYYHFAVRHGEPTRFQGPDPVRYVYLAVLLSHTVLATVVAPLALFTAYQGLRDRLARHVKVARWTLPVWLYVSVTGVVVYVMLYQLYPAP